MEVSNVLPLKRSLAKDERMREIKASLKENLAAIAKPEYRNDVEFLLRACQIAEYLVRKKDKVDKKSLVLAVMQEVFVGVTDEQRDMMARNIEFLHSNKRIKKVRMLTMVSRVAWSWAKKKLCS